MSQALPAVPFDGQIFIDSESVKWRWDATLEVWHSVGPVDTIPLADAETDGLLSPQHKILLDSIPEAGGAFGIVIEPQLLLQSADNPIGAIQGNIEIRSDSLTIECADWMGHTNVSGNISGCDVPEGGSLPSMRFKLSDKFLNTFCLEVSGGKGPIGDKGDKGNKGKGGFSDSPAGLPGEPGPDAITSFRLTDVKVVDLDTTVDTAVVNLELNALESKLSYTTAKMNVPNDDDPANKILADPINRGVSYPLTAGPGEYVTLDDWELSVPAGDPLSDPDLYLLTMPKGTQVGDSFDLSAVPLTDYIQAVVDYYKEQLDIIDADYLDQARTFIEGKDREARTILASMGQRVAECEFSRPLQFCLGVQPDDCDPQPAPTGNAAALARTVVLAIYDEANIYDSRRDANGLVNWQSAKSQWESWLETAEIDNSIRVRGGIMQPLLTSLLDNGVGGFTSISGGSILDIKCASCLMPRDTDRSAINYFTTSYARSQYHDVSGCTNTLTSNNIISAFNTITQNGEYDPTMLVFVLDNSGSVLTNCYSSELTAAKASLQAAYPTMTILQDEITTIPEDWLSAMTRALQTILETGTV